ncbi:family 10 glycosylhydrolase [Rhodohalobacter sp. 8-1]|uniref:family 10 glycosylhydrolase n=1 Tax=Rhodohalobacter sp. 8-1 TaxID=3131972 RepID=UPI0030ED32D3
MIYPKLKKYLLLFLLLTCTTILAEESFAQILAPDREFRATWLTTTWGLDWPNSSHLPKQQQLALLEILDRHVEQGLNAVIFQVSARGDALYKSKTLPWAYVLTGRPGVDPGWDPLAFAIRESHKRGLELHAWFNVFSIAYNTDSDSPPDANQPNIRYAHPEWVSSVVINEDVEHLWLNPGIPEAREWQVQNVMEMVENYDVDAVHFDRIRYFSGGYDNDSELFEQYNPEGLTDIDDWRRHNVTELVREASVRIQDLKPWVKIGAAVSGHYNKDSSDGWPARYGYGEVFADSRLWAERGYVDYLSPMNYWDISSPPRFDFIAEDWAAHSNGNYAVYMGAAPYKQSVFKELHLQIDVTRTHDIAGQVHYRYSHVSEISDHYSGRYDHISLISPMAGKSQTPPPMVQNVELSIQQDSLSISWEADGIQNEPVTRNKFAVYCSACGPDRTRQRLSVTGTTTLKLPITLWPDGERASIEVTSLNRNYIESAPFEQTLIITNEEIAPELADRIELHQNYPNPFNPTTQISFDVSQTGRITLTVYDMTGRMVAKLMDKTVPSGFHHVTFDGGGLSSGIYLYRLQTDSKTITKKMTLIK